MQNKLRIIGGQWRSRVIAFDDAPGLRPTPNRVRETLFNWLQYDIPGSCCLDCFAGSGALGFEAASRGAKAVLQIEQNPVICRQLKASATALGATQIKLVQADAFRYLTETLDSFDIVFIDPPFGQGLALQTCHWLEDKGLLNPNAKIYLETETELTLTVPSNWQLLKQKAAGEVAYCLFQRA